MSRLVPHLQLPTSDLPQRLDDEGYQLNEDGQLELVDADVERGEGQLSQKVGPFLDVAESLVLLQSLRQSRAVYLSTFLPLFQTRSKVRAQPSPPPAPHTQIPFGRCTLQIGPCTFTDTRLFEVRYAAQEDLRNGEEGARAKALEAKKAAQAQGSAVKPKLPPSASGSMASPKPPAAVGITPELIAQVNIAAASDPTLQNILNLAAAGKATTAQLQSLGSYITNLQKKAVGAASSPGPSTPAGSSAPMSFGPSRVGTPASLVADSSSADKKPISIPSSTSNLPSPTLQKSLVLSPSSAPPSTNAVTSSSIIDSEQPVLVSGSRASRLKIPHDIVIEFEENKTDRFLLPLYRCLVSRDEPSPDAASGRDHVLDPTLLPPSAQSTVRISFFVPLDQTVVPPALGPFSTLASRPDPNPFASSSTSSALHSAASRTVTPIRPWAPPSPAAEPAEGVHASARARAARERLAKETWDREERERVVREEAALAVRLAEEQKTDEQRKGDAEQEKLEKLRKRKSMKQRMQGEPSVWPTTMVMTGVGESVWDNVKRNWERYLELGAGFASTGEVEDGETAPGVETMTREFEALLDRVPSRTYLHPRYLPPLPPAIVEASTDKYTLKVYAPSVKSAAPKVEIQAGEAGTVEPKKRASRKRRVDVPEDDDDEAAVVVAAPVKLKAKPRAKRIRIGGVQRTIPNTTATPAAPRPSPRATAPLPPPPPPPPPPPSHAPVPTPTPTPLEILQQPSSARLSRSSSAHSSSLFTNEPLHHRPHDPHQHHQHHRLPQHRPEPSYVPPENYAYVELEHHHITPEPEPEPHLDFGGWVDNEGYGMGEGGGQDDLEAYILLDPVEEGRMGEEY